jgi:hypothetical protein
MECVLNVIALLLKSHTVTVLVRAKGLAWVNTWGRKPLLGFVYNRILYNNYMSLAEFRSIERMFEEKIPYFATLSDDGRNRFIARTVDLNTPLHWLFALILIALAILPAALIALGEYPDAYVGD